MKWPITLGTLGNNGCRVLNLKNEKILHTIFLRTYNLKKKKKTVTN